VQDINNVILVARLVRDAELKYTANGYAILNFSIANNRSVKRNDEWQDEVSFFQCNIFGKRAESLAEYMIKGKQVVISGSLKQDRWTDKDGNNRSVVKIMVDKLQFVGGKRNQESVSSNTPSVASDPDITPMAEEDFEDDKIPF